MYCIECGEQIPESSKFCSHCGKPQNKTELPKKEKVAEKIIENETVKQVFKKQKRNLDFQLIKKTFGWYLIWFFLHLGILLIFSDNNSYYKYKFVPFSDGSKIDDYDFREFLVYTIFPLAILFIWSMIRTKSNTDSIESIQNI